MEPPGYPTLIGFSPDGAWLMYGVRYDHERSSLWVARADESGAQQEVISALLDELARIEGDGR
jgi:hypothetical protein